MTQAIPLEVCFKGERDYLQGADLYNALIDALGGTWRPQDMNRFVLTFRSFAHSRCKVRLHDPDSPLARPENAVSEFQFATETAKHLGWIVESGEPIDCRLPFLEEEIVERCTIDGAVVRIAGTTRFSPMEVAVAMTKQLHNSLYPAPSGRWIVTKMDLQRPLAPGDADGLTIELLQKLKTDLTRSRMATPVGTLGDLYFSLVGR